MLSTSSTLLNIGVIGIAVAIIAVVIWVAFLANKLNKMSSQFEQELNRVESLARSQAMRQIPQQKPQAQQSASATRPESSASAIKQQNAAQAQNMQSSNTKRNSTAQRGLGVMTAQAQNVKTVQSAKGAAKTPVKKTKKKNKGKPVIPFGEDKRAQDRARAAYAPNAVETDYDPDSIDFSKVQGLQGRQAPSATVNFGNANTMNVAGQQMQQPMTQSAQQIQQTQIQQCAQQAQQQNFGQQPQQANPRSQQSNPHPSVNQKQVPRTKIMNQNVNNVAPVSGVSKGMATGPINGSPRQRQASPRQRVSNPRARAAKQQAARTPSAQVQTATSQTRAGFQQLESQMRDAAIGSTAWIEEDKRRMEERQMRQAQRAKMSEEREQAQLRREAEYIVRAHQQNR